MRCIVLTALFLVCVFRICCQRRLTRWWSGPLAVRLSGWTGTSSVASSRPHPGTTLSSSCSLPCSPKGSALSAGMYKHRHTQDQCTECRPQSAELPVLLQVYSVHWSLPTVEEHKCELLWYFTYPPSSYTYRLAHLGKHRKPHYITKPVGHVDIWIKGTPASHTTKGEWINSPRTRPTRPTYPLSKHLMHKEIFQRSQSKL